MTEAIQDIAEQSANGSQPADNAPPADRAVNFAAQLDALGGLFNDMCDALGATAGVIVVQGPDGKEVVYRIGHVYDVAAITAAALRMMKDTLLPPLQTDADYAAETVVRRAQLDSR